MAVGVIGALASSQEPGVLPDGLLTLDPAGYARFKRLSKPRVPVSEIELGDVIEIGRVKAGPFKGRMVVETVATRGVDTCGILLNGKLQTTPTIRAIHGSK